jgi:hypothetical protein
MNFENIKKIVPFPTNSNYDKQNLNTCLMIATNLTDDLIYYIFGNLDLNVNDIRFDNYSYESDEYQIYLFINNNSIEDVIISCFFVKMKKEKKEEKLIKKIICGYIMDYIFNPELSLGLYNKLKTIDLWDYLKYELKKEILESLKRKILYWELLLNTESFLNDKVLYCLAKIYKIKNPNRDKIIIECKKL